MLLLRKSNTKRSSRRQINMRGVEDGIIMLPHHEYRIILEMSSINFELKSEDEQDAIIETYQSVLNSLSTGLQIIVRVREMNMEKYITDVRERLAGENEQVYRQQIENYTHFVSQLVRKNRILTRKFYVVVPYSAPPDMEFDAIKEQLFLNCDIVGKGLARLGMQAYSLTTIEVLDLFYTYYNPTQAKHQPLSRRAFTSQKQNIIQSEARR